MFVYVQLLVGTLGAEIYEFSSDDGANAHDGPLVQGHCKWELWGLAVRAVLIFTGFTCNRCVSELSLSNNAFACCCSHRLPSNAL